ncbi:Imm63 family immunity protein [Acinetobacter sp. 10FS3-1]|nr:hypothetical protein E5Y90_15980 [Acinetobacter sp. 10FS3-1]
MSEERGGVIFEKTTKDFEELLYWIMGNLIYSYSYKFELKKALLEKLTL